MISIPIDSAAFKLRFHFCCHRQDKRRRHRYRHLYLYLTKGHVCFLELSGTPGHGNRPASHADEILSALSMSDQNNPKTAIADEEEEAG